MLIFPEAQQYHVYTLQPLSNPLQQNPISAILSQQQQQYIHEQQELKGIQHNNENNKSIYFNSNKSFTCSFQRFTSKIWRCRKGFHLHRNTDEFRCCVIIITVSALAVAVFNAKIPKYYVRRYISEFNTTHEILS